MKNDQAVIALAALAQAHRLQIFRLLIINGEPGLSVGEIAEQIDVAAPTLSFHLKTLKQAGLIQQQREGRFLYYTADFSVTNALLTYLVDDCCQGKSCLAANNSRISY